MFNRLLTIFLTWYFTTSFLFIVYINDLLAFMENSESKVTLYADDTILYCSANSVNEAIIKNQRGCDLLERWCNNNRLSVNTTKSKNMCITPNDEKGEGHVVLYNKKLENVCKYNYLGVIIDNRLSFKEFVDDKYTKVNLRVYQLGKIRKYISADTACIIYKQTIVPLLDYCDFMIESFPVIRYTRLENLQERALKYIDNKANKGRDLYKIYRIQPLRLRWREHICCMMFRQSKFTDKLDYVRPLIRLRSNKKVKFKKVLKRNYQLYLKSPMARGIKIWETLTAEMQKATTKVKFKTMIKPLCYYWKLMLELNKDLWDWTWIQYNHCSSYTHFISLYIHYICK